MAEEALNILEEELNCSICLDIYTDPKLLQCFHVYCRQCLVPLVVRDQQGHLGLTCPTCRQVTPIPERGVAGLQSAFHINRFLEIRESLQRVENPVATPQGAASTDVNPDVRKASHCFVHEGKELELYCETCGELICYKCITKGSKHRDHDYEELDQAFTKYTEEMSLSLEPLEKQVTTIKKALAQVHAICGEISDQRTATANNIHSTFRRLRQVLNVRETELIGQLDQLTQDKLKGLAAQSDQIETTLAQLCSCLHFVKESLRTGSEGDVLVMKTNTARQVEELTTPLQPDTLQPNTEADIVFSASVDMNAAGTRASCSVERRGQSQNDISYQPTIKGRHQLHIKAEGQHIRGSPFSIAVMSPVEKLGTPILTIGGVREPTGVAINQRGEVVVVAERGGQCVSVFSPSGEKLRLIGVPHVRGVTVDGEGNILVSCENHCIQRFTGDGRFVESVGTMGSGPLQFDWPIDIAFNANNNKVYVADSANHRIQVLNSDLTFSSTFGKKGSGKGQFDWQRGIVCDSTGKVYVADTDNHRIQVFTAEGKFLLMFGRRGEGRGELDWPAGVAVDASGMVYVSEGDNHRVSVFTSEGQFVTSFGREGEGPGEFNDPRGLAVNTSGVVYVCDTDNKRVQIF